jgi:hypothetical protein
VVIRIRVLDEDTAIHRRRSRALCRAMAGARDDDHDHLELTILVEKPSSNALVSKRKIGPDVAPYLGMTTTRYSIKVGNRWVGSPTSTLTERPQFRAVIDSLDEARALARMHGGTVMVEPSDWRAIPSEVVS